MITSETSWNPVALPWILSGVAALSATLYLIKNWDKAQNQRAALFTFITLAEWDIAYSVYLCATTVPAQKFWIKIYFIGVAFLPAAFFNYTLNYTRITKQIWKITLRAASLFISFLFVIAVATNDLHHLAWDPQPAHTTSLMLDASSYGILLWTFIGYAFFIIILELILLSLSFFGKVNLHRWQAVIIIIMVLLTGVAIANNHSLIPLVGGFLALALVWLMPKVREQSFLPYSYKIATQTTANALIIIDAHQHIIEINRSAEKLLECTEDDFLNVNIREIPLLNTISWDTILTTSASRSQIRLVKNGSPQQFSLQILTLDNWLGRPSGHIISLYNITRAESLADTLQSKSLELQYNYELQNTLSQIITQVGYSTNPQEALQKITTHLHQLELDFILGVLDTEKNSLIVKYISLNTKLLKTAEKITGVPVIGHQFSTSIWPFLDIFQNKKIIFDNNTFDLVHQLLPQIPAPILKRAYTIATLPIDTPVMYIPLLAEEKPIGAIAIWGKRLKNAYQDTLYLFANQIAITLDNARRYEIEKQVNEELSRSKAFTSALSIVAAEIMHTPDLDRIMQVLGEELGKLGVGNLLATLSADREIARISYISTSPTVLETIKKFTGADMKGYGIKRKYWQRFADEYFYQGKALFIENPVEFTSIVMPKIPFSLLEKALKLSIGHTKDKAIYLPLIEGKNTYGILGVWGTDLREEDIPALSVFASQVSATMKGAEQIKKERAEARKIARANNFITTLNQLAAQLQSTSDTHEFLERLGIELKSININFMFSLINEEKTALKLEYLTIEGKWLSAVEKISRTKAVGFLIHKEDFSYWDEIVERKKPIIIEDSLQAAIEGIATSTKIPQKRIAPGLTALFNRAGWNIIAIWIPLIVDNNVIGTINMWGKELEPSDLPILNIFANQVASAFKSATLYTAEQERSQDLAQSLEEKNVLLKEVHHRVKNNLQVISSLLNLQSATLSDEKILDMFTESRDRIRSMALVHEKLYKSDDLAQINFGEYLRGLSAQLLQSYSSQSRSINMDMEIENINLSIEKAVPCGLIVNEIITNSIKHAFPKATKGSVTIKLHKTQKKQVKLVIADDGIGIPKNLPFDNPSTLGMQIISLLTKQLNAEVKVSRKNGTHFEIIF